MTERTDDLSLPSPSLLRRLMAMLYDTFLVLPLIMLSAALTLGAYVYGMELGGLEANPDELPTLLRQCVIMLTVITFFAIFWMKSGQTLGMQAWRIKVVVNDGSKLGIYHCVVRCLGALLSTACLGLGYLWCLWDSNGKTWHDYLSKSQLVLLPKREKS